MERHEGGSLGPSQGLASAITGTPAAKPTGPPASKPVGRRKALLIGINYFGTSGELHGCINDVRKMHSFLAERGFGAADSTLVLTDDVRQPAHQPTRANILAGMAWLVHGASPGDILFFHFSGHGGQQVAIHRPAIARAVQTTSHPGAVHRRPDAAHLPATHPFSPLLR